MLIILMKICAFALLNGVLLYGASELSKNRKVQYVLGFASVFLMVLGVSIMLYLVLQD